MTNFQFFLVLFFCVCLILFSELRSFRRWRPTWSPRSTTSWATGRTARRTTDLRPGFGSAHLLTLLLNHTADVGTAYHSTSKSAGVSSPLLPGADVCPGLVPPLRPGSSQVPAVANSAERFANQTRASFTPSHFVRLLSVCPSSRVDPSWSILSRHQLQTMQNFFRH